MTKLVRPQEVGNQVLSVLGERITMSICREDGKTSPERTLAEEFGIPRPSVRVAPDILIARQVLEARQGDSYYVSVKPQRDFLQSQQELLGRRSNWEADVFDFSCHVEGYMVSLAVERRTDANLKHIGFWRQKSESACESGHLEHQTKADMSFHQTIADAAHNILFSHLSGGLPKILYRQTRNSIIYFNQAEDPRPKLAAQHRAICEAILECRPAGAVEATKIHLNYVTNSTLQNKEYKSRNKHTDTLAQNGLKRVQDW